MTTNSKPSLTVPLIVRKAYSLTMNVSPAEGKLLERLRAFRETTLVTLYVGGDGEPKELFAQSVQREELARR